MKLGSVVKTGNSYFLLVKRGQWRLLKSNGTLGSTYGDSDLNEIGESVHVLDADLESLDSPGDYAALFAEVKRVAETPAAPAEEESIDLRNALLYAMYGQPEAPKKKAPQIRKVTPAPPEVLSMIRDLETGRSVDPLTLSQIAIRNVKAIYRNGAPWEDGFSFSTDPGALKTRRSIGLGKEEVLRLLRGETLKLTFRKMGTADYWADWSGVEKATAKMQDANRRREESLSEEQKKKQLELAASTISDEDPDVLEFARIMFSGQDPEDYPQTLEQVIRSSRGLGKKLVYSIRTKDPITKDYILRYLGWPDNKSYRKFFKTMTGIALPSTGKASVALLSDWYLK